MLGRSEDFRSIAVLFLLTVVVLVVFPEFWWLLLLLGGVADSDSRMLASGNLSWFVSTILVKPLVGSVLNKSSWLIDKIHFVCFTLTILLSSAQMTFWVMFLQSESCCWLCKVQKC